MWTSPAPRGLAPPTSGNAASKQADFIKWSGRIDLSNGDLGDHSVLAECAGPHEVEDGLALAREPGCPIWHQTLPLCNPGNGNQVTHVCNNKTKHC